MVRDVARRGELDRAIRIHQNLVDRSDLKQEQRLKAHDLAGGDAPGRVARAGALRLVGLLLAGNHLCGDILDAHDPISSHYILEVSSPGINRPLKKQADFQRFAGQKALVETKIPISGRKRYKGLLLGVENGNVIISVDGADHCIPIEQIRKARLDIL
jgi:hypothetical protein